MSDNRIRLFRNKVNCGAAVSRNNALQEAKGRWIAFLDSDDLWESAKLEKQIRYMEEHHINSDIYHPYVCGECGQWHIGHNKQKSKKSKKRK